MWWRSTKVCAARKRCGGRRDERELESLALAPWASRRRQDLLDLLDQLTPKIQELTRALEAGGGETSRDATADDASRSGPADRTGLRVGDWNAGTFCIAASRSPAMWDWFPRKSPAAIGADWDTSANRATSLLRFLLVEAAQVTVRSHPQWRSQFFHLAMRRGRKIAKVAMARKLAVASVLDVAPRLGLRTRCKSSVRRVENPPLMLWRPRVRSGSRGYGVRGSFY